MEQLYLKIHCWSCELAIRKLPQLLQQLPPDTDKTGEQALECCYGKFRVFCSPSRAGQS